MGGSAMAIVKVSPYFTLVDMTLRLVMSCGVLRILDPHQQAQVK